MTTGWGQSEGMARVWGARGGGGELGRVVHSAYGQGRGKKYERGEETSNVCGVRVRVTRLTHHGAM